MPPSPDSTPSRSKALQRIATLSALALTVVVLWGIIFDRWRPPGKRALPLSVANLNLTPLGSPSLSFNQIWFPREGGRDGWWHWTGTLEGSTIHIYSKEPGRYQFSASLGTTSSRKINIMLNGGTIQEIDFPQGAEKTISTILSLNKENNSLTFSTDQPGVTHTGDSRKLAFYIKNAKITLAAPQAVSFNQDWFSREGSDDNWWYWTGGLTESAIQIQNSGEEGVYELFALVGAINQRKVYIVVNGALSTILEFPQAGEQMLSLSLRLKSGSNSLILSTDQGPIQPIHMTHVSFHSI